jgi:hypothetical protein
MKGNRAILPLILCLAIVAVTYGCGGGQATPPPISLSLSPSSAQTVDQGQTVKFNATVANDQGGKGVSWGLSGTGCTGTACGTLSNQTATSVTYTAPTAVTANLAVKIIATSLADGTKSISGSVTVVTLPSITTSSLADATAGTAYTATLQATGGIAPYSWTITNGTLPPGLDISPDGIISGTPAGGGKFSFTAQVADAGNPSLTATANLSITAVVLPLTITTTTLPNGTVDAAYKQTVQVTGGIPPYTWSITSGTLPSWATLNPSTGTISGIPGSTSAANFTVQVVDSETLALTDTQTFTLTVVAGSGANNSHLNGHYAFLFNGFDDTTSSQIAIAGSFTAADGTITAGVEDQNGPGGAVLNVPFTGTYNVASDNRGAFTITTATGSKTYALVLNSVKGGVAQKARFVEFDDITGTSGRRGSGLMRLQDTTAFAQSKITGPYAFGFEGQDATAKREVMAGAFNADGAGNIPVGAADVNVVGTASNPSLTGTYTAPSIANGRATMKLNPSSGSGLDLAAYVVSADELFVLTTDTITSNGLISGAILSQSSSSFDNTALNAPAVYYQSGVNSNGNAAQSSAEIGLLTPNGSGGLSTTYDKSPGGGIAAQTFAATYSVLSGGRVTISGWYGDSSSPERILYLLDKNKAFFLDTDATAGLGFVEPQSVPAGGFSTASFTGIFSIATAAPVVSPDPNACGTGTLDASGTYSQVSDFSVTSGDVIDQTTTGNYSIAANGRGAVTNVQITASTVRGSILGMFVVAAFIFGSRKPRARLGPAYAMMCFTILLATTPASCSFQSQLVFYAVSPTKAILMPESQIFSPTPVISFIEQ